MIRTNTRPFAFAMAPHGLMSDPRLTPTERLTVVALLYWALDGSRCTMANGRLAEYLGCSTATVDRSLRTLKEFGYIRTEKVKPSDRNATGRVVVLCWVADPSVIPSPPTRRGDHHGRSEGHITGEVQTKVPLRMEKDDRPRERPEVVVSSPNSQEQSPEVAPGIPTVEPKIMCAKRTLSIDPTIMWPTGALSIDPAIDRIIVAEIPDERARLQVRAQVPAWVANHAVDRIILAIREALARRKRETIHHLAGYVAKILANWRDTGSPTPRLASRPSTGSTTTRDSTLVATIVAVRRQDEADLATQEGQMMRRWEALPDDERRAIEDQVDRDHPRPGRLAESSWRAIRKSLCLEKLFAEFDHKQG